MLSRLARRRSQQVFCQVHQGSYICIINAPEGWFRFIREGCSGRVNYNSLFVGLRCSPSISHTTESLYSKEKCIVEGGFENGIEKFSKSTVLKRDHAGSARNCGWTLGDRRSIHQVDDASRKEAGKGYTNNTPVVQNVREVKTTRKSRADPRERREENQIERAKGVDPEGWDTNIQENEGWEKYSIKRDASRYERGKSKSWSTEASSFQVSSEVAHDSTESAQTKGTKMGISLARNDGVRDAHDKGRASRAYRWGRPPRDRTAEFGPPRGMKVDWWEREGFSLQSPASESPPGSIFETKQLKWQLKMARKREKQMLEEESQPNFEAYLDRESMGQDWRDKKIAWMVQELCALRPNPLVKLLNAQRSWISIQDVRAVIYKLLKCDEGLRAVRTLKWVRQMDWYEPDFEVYTELIMNMAQHSKHSRYAELYDMMITHGMVPTSETYLAIIGSAVREGGTEMLKAAWGYYAKMKKFAEMKAPPDLLTTLFEALSTDGQSKRFYPQIEELLVDMTAAGLKGNDRMYSKMCELAALNGDVEKVDFMLNEMRAAGIPPVAKVLETVFTACRNAMLQSHVEGESESVFSGDLDLDKLEEAEAARGSEPVSPGSEIPSDFDLISSEEAGVGTPMEGFSGKQYSQSRTRKLLHRVASAEESFKQMGIPLSTSAMLAFMETYRAAREHKKVLSLWNKLHKNLQGLSKVSTARAYSVVVDSLVQQGLQEQAEALVDEAVATHSGSHQHSFNALLKHYVRTGQLDSLEGKFEEMQGGSSPPNQTSYNRLLEGYLRAGMLDKARKVFDELCAPGGLCPNELTWNLMLDAYGKAGSKQGVKEVYEIMQKVGGRKVQLAPAAKAVSEKAVGNKRLTADEKRKLKLDDGQRESIIGVMLGGGRMETHDGDRTYEIHFEQLVVDSGRMILMRHLYQMFQSWAQGEPSFKELSMNLQAAKPPLDVGASAACAVDEAMSEGQSAGEACSEQQVGGSSRGDGGSRGAVAGPPPGHHGGARSSLNLVLHFATVSHGAFRFYAHQWYPEGRGVIPRLVHRWLSPRTLAYWYMYGGSRDPDSGGILLNAEGYSTKEIKLVTSALKARSMDCECKKRKSGAVICFRDESAAWLWKLMEPYILPELVELLNPLPGVKFANDFYEDTLSGGQESTGTKRIERKGTRMDALADYSGGDRLLEKAERVGDGGRISKFNQV